MRAARRGAATLRHANDPGGGGAVSKEGEMRFITAVAREDKEAKRLAYSSVGNVEQARQAGESPATS
ncbi:MAG: hypothetical protein H0V56_12760 [Chthoniobacterales bacterium]|nr:hypothetical protein [Chthoniobacterales bacterium]